MNVVFNTAFCIIAAALISLIVAIPGVVMMIAGYDNPWFVVAAVAYFVIQLSTEKYWMPSSIRTYINQ